MAASRSGYSPVFVGRACREVGSNSSVSRVASGGLAVGGLGSAFLARSASVIQPAATRACMTSASASSRDISLPSRMPACLVVSPLLALGPADQIVGGATGEVLDGLDVVLAELDQHLRGHAGHVLQRILDAELLAPGLEFGLELVEIFAGAALQLVRGFLVEPFDAGQFLVSTSASSSTDANPSDASNWPTTSSTFSASMNSWVDFSKSAWRRSDSSCSVRMSMSQPVSCDASRTFWPRRPIASDSWLFRAPRLRYARGLRRARPWRLPPAPAR